uniref:Seryl-tRNA synthetase n=1 Tax=Clastoptera arizonana TaxID=38151 RepID=A0A1B6CAB7_9HEMI
MLQYCLKTVRGLHPIFSIQRFSSALFVTKDRETVYSVLIPYLDCDQRFKNLGELKKNVHLRELNVNVEDLKDLWEFYKEWAVAKQVLERKRLEVVKDIKKAELIDDCVLKEKEMKRLMLQGKLLKEEFKNVAKTCNEIEDVVINPILNLPNDLHPNTPLNDVVIKNFSEENNLENKDHLTVGKDLNYVYYQNSVTYFLQNDAALFELAVGSFFKNKFISNNFSLFCNTDFAKSVLMEGVTLSPVNPSTSLLLKESEDNFMRKLHLTGGASLFPFCAFHAKQTVISENLPLKYITVGRNYNPNRKNKFLEGLYSVWQSTSAEIFIALDSNDTNMNLEFEKTLNILYQLYIDLGLKFRIVNQCAKLLHPWESFRSSIQIYSFTNEVFVEVGHLTIINDFISKRLRMCYCDEKQDKFLKVISGTVVNIPVLLALCLERSKTKLLFPKVINEFKL